MKKYILILTVTLMGAITSANDVYDETTTSMFPESVQILINESISNECLQDNWIYGIVDEKIEEGEFSATLSVGEDYPFESYIVVSKNELGKLKLEMLECPPAEQY